MNKKKVLKVWVKIVFVVILLSILFVGSYIILKETTLKKGKPVYNYKTNRDVNYKVYLLPNTFYENEYLGMGKLYPADLINYIDIDFIYNYSGSQVTDMKYTYSIVGTIVGNYEKTEDGNTEIWTKKYTMLDKKTNEIHGTEISVNQNLKINYQDYSKVVNEFKSQFHLPIDAHLGVKLLINYEGYVDDVKINGNDEVEVNIPLSESTLSITSNNVRESKGVKTLEVKANKLNIGIGISIIVLDFVIFVMSFKHVFISKKSLYNKVKERIIKDYADILAESESMPNISNLETVDITNFDDMIDIEEGYKCPILYYEVKVNKECWFIMIYNNYVYRFILRSEDL